MEDDGYDEADLRALEVRRCFDRQLMLHCVSVILLIFCACTPQIAEDAEDCPTLSAAQRKHVAQTVYDSDDEDGNQLRKFIFQEAQRARKPRKRKRKRQYKSKVESGEGLGDLGATADEGSESAATDTDDGESVMKRRRASKPRVERQPSERDSSERGFGKHGLGERGSAERKFTERDSSGRGSGARSGSSGHGTGERNGTGKRIKPKSRNDDNDDSSDSNDKEGGDSGDGGDGELNVNEPRRRFSNLKAPDASDTIIAPPPPRSPANCLCVLTHNNILRDSRFLAGTRKNVRAKARGLVTSTTLMATMPRVMITTPYQMPRRRSTHATNVASMANYCSATVQVRLQSFQ
jgi:hypothetical protein